MTYHKKKRMCDNLPKFISILLHFHFSSTRCITCVCLCMKINLLLLLLQKHTTLDTHSSMISYLCHTPIIFSSFILFYFIINVYLFGMLSFILYIFFIWWMVMMLFWNNTHEKKRDIKSFVNFISIICFIFLYMWKIAPD